MRGAVQDVGSISGSGRYPEEGYSNPFLYSCLENPMEREAWQATVHGVAKSGTWLSTHTHTHTHTYRYRYGYRYRHKHKNIQGWFPLGLIWPGLISLLSKGLSRVFSNTTIQKHQLFSAQTFFIVQISHLYMSPEKTIAFTMQDFVLIVTSLLFNMPSRLVIAFLPRSMCLLISWLQSPSAVILEPKTLKSVTVSIVSPSICYEMMGPDAMIFVFWVLSFKPDFSLFFHFHQETL